MAKKMKAQAAPTVERKEPTPQETIKWQRDEIEYHLARAEKQWKDVEADFLKTAEGDLSYAVRYRAEKILLSYFERLQAQELRKIYKDTIDDQFGGVEATLWRIREVQKEKIDRILEDPYRHNSTCAMSNFEQECEKRVKSDFWKQRGFGGGTAQQVICCLEKWLEAEKQLLASY